MNIIPDAGSVQMPQGGIMPDEGSIQVQPAGPEVGGLESLARGAFQGVTFGFGDEISGAVRSLVGGTSYEQERNAAREANKAASESNPFTYGAAELGAGLITPIPGLGAAKVGASAISHAATAAIAGGAAGLGASEADLTKGDFQGAVNDTIQSALVGGAIGGVAGKIGQVIGKAGAKSEELAIKALAGAESKTSGAAWQKTRRMVNNPETRNILHEPVQLETEAGKPVTTTLDQVAGKEPNAIQEVVDSQVSKIGDELRPIYAKADAANGGVKLSDYLAHLDGELAATKSMAPAEAKVYRNAIGEIKENAIEQWGHPDLSAALGTAEAKTPAVQQAILKSLDTKIPSEAVRAEATSLQKIGFKTVDPLNPGLQTQVKRDMGNMVRDFVNEHVMQTLGPQDHSALTSLNKRMNAWLGVGTVATARAEKQAAGNISGRGLIGELAGKGSMVASTIGALASGNPALLLAPLGAKALEHAPAAARVATRAVAKIDSRLKAVAEAAAAGNPFAQKLLASIKQTPGGVARLAALQRQAGAPPGIAPAEGQDAAQPIAAQ